MGAQQKIYDVYEERVKDKKKEMYDLDDATLNQYQKDMVTSIRESERAAQRGWIARPTPLRAEQAVVSRHLLEALCELTLKLPGGLSNARAGEEIQAFAEGKGKWARPSDVKGFKKEAGQLTFDGKLATMRAKVLDVAAKIKHLKVKYNIKKEDIADEVIVDYMVASVRPEELRQLIADLRKNNKPKYDEYWEDELKGGRLIMQKCEDWDAGSRLQGKNPKAQSTRWSTRRGYSRKRYLDWQDRQRRQQPRRRAAAAAASRGRGRGSRGRGRGRSRRKVRTLKCWWPPCGGPHTLEECTKCTRKQKEEVMRQKRVEWAAAKAKRVPKRARAARSAASWELAVAPQKTSAGNKARRTANHGRQGVAAFVPGDSTGQAPATELWRSPTEEHAFIYGQTNIQASKDAPAAKNQLREGKKPFRAKSSEKSRSEGAIKKSDLRRGFDSCDCGDVADEPTMRGSGRDEPDVAPEPVVYRPSGTTGHLRNPGTQRAGDEYQAAAGVGVTAELQRALQDDLAACVQKPMRKELHYRQMPAMIKRLADFNSNGARWSDATDAPRAARGARAPAAAAGYKYPTAEFHDADRQLCGCSIEDRSDPSSPWCLARYKNVSKSKDTERAGGRYRLRFSFAGVAVDCGWFKYPWTAGLAQDLWVHCTGTAQQIEGYQFNFEAHDRRFRNMPMKKALLVARKIRDFYKRQAAVLVAQGLRVQLKFPRWHCGLFGPAPAVFSTDDGPRSEALPVPEPTSSDTDADWSSVETETERQVVKTPFLPSKEKAESELTPFGSWVPPAHQFTKEDGVPPFPAPLPFFSPNGQRRKQVRGGRLYYNCGKNSSTSTSAT